MARTVVLFNPSRFSEDVWLPTLWSQSKTYYEKNGNKVKQWNWALPIADIHGDDIEQIKLILGHIEPDVFAVSLYVWNYQIGHKIAEWVKKTYPNCFVITGGPHQYFKYDTKWFQKHPYIDASLPGDSYGELCIQEVLDNLDDQGNIDYDQVSNLCYPSGKSKFPKYSKKVLTKKTKGQFDYKWTSFAEQKVHIDNYISHAKLNNPSCNLLAILETTRGCPYGCTYCDWGGGINTTVIKKDLADLEKDLTLLCSYKLQYMFIADANFGIFGERDVDIIKLIVEKKQEFGTNAKIGYGGYAKTANKLPYIKKILELDLQNGLSLLKELKLSMQTLDPDVLTYIDRKNIDLDDQLNAFKPLIVNHTVPVFIEMIFGLPGMNMDKFYHELTVLGSNDLSVQWYEWLMLPEAPAYDPAYRERFNLGTVKKSDGWYYKELGADREIVVSSATFSTDDYLDMLLATSLYRAFIQGSFFKNSIEYIKTNIGLGKFIQYLLAQYKNNKDWNNIKYRWNKILTVESALCTLELADFEIRIDHYFVGCAYINHNDFHSFVTDALGVFECPKKLIKKDIKYNIIGVKEQLPKLVNDFLHYKRSILQKPKGFFSFLD